MRRLLRVVLPLAFLAVTAWTVVDLVNEGIPQPSTSQISSTPTARAFQLAVAADVGSDARGRATLDAMGASRSDIYLFLGDLSYAGPGSERRWCDLVRQRVGPVAPVQVLAGNHEEDSGEDGRLANFARCLPDRLSSTGEYGRQYYFDLDKLARFILISPDLTIDGKHYYYGEGNANERWLARTIDDARDRGIRWVVVGMHKSCISVGEYYCNVYQDLMDLLVSKKVDLVLHGHDHSYQRSKQLASGRLECPQVRVDAFDPDCVVDDGSDGQYRRGRGPVFVISGMGGGELYPMHPDDAEAGYFARTLGKGADQRFGFVSLCLSQESLSLAFVPSSDGTFTDGFSIGSVATREPSPSSGLSSPPPSPKPAC